MPAEVIVPVAVQVIVPVPAHVIAAEAVTLPATVVVLITEKVPVKPVKLSDLALLLVELETVTAPLAASKNTSSEVVGTACPPAPPEVSAHLEPAVEFQTSVPPTQ